MSKFIESVRQHLSKYKEEVLGIHEDGVWKNNGKQYSHILPEHLCMRNLIDGGYHDSLCSMALYLGSKLHSGFHHLTSSQALTINLFGPMKKDNDFSAIPIKIKAVNIKSEFEHIEPDSTNFDFFIESDGNRIYFEVKYLENTLSTTSQSKNNESRWKTYYKNSMENILQDETNAEKLFFSQYQLWRNIIRVNEKNNIVVFVFLNARQDLENEVTGAIDKIKDEYRKQIKILHIDDICKQGEQIDKFKNHYTEFSKKYIPVTQSK